MINLNNLITIWVFVILIYGTLNFINWVYCKIKKIKSNFTKKNDFKEQQITETNKGVDIIEV